MQTLPETDGRLVENILHFVRALRKAGLKVGGIVGGLNGKPVENWNEMRLEISRRRPGEVLTLNYIREGRGALARLTVAERPLDR